MECTGKAEYVKAPFCMKCGKPVRQDTELCLDCQGKETSFKCGRAVFVYNSCMQQSVAQFKYGGRTGYAGFYASKAAELYGSWIAYPQMHLYLYQYMGREGLKEVLTSQE